VLADFADNTKDEAITQIVRNSAAFIAANTGLLSDGIKPKVVAYSDDFFGSHEDILLLAAQLGQAALTLLDEQDQPSDELVAAAVAMQKRKERA
jgi:hypothetical protein